MNKPAWWVERNTYNTMIVGRGGAVALVLQREAADILAAAPELFAALESLTAAVALDLHPESVREALAKARAAIDLARGIQ